VCELVIGRKDRKRVREGMGGNSESESERECVRVTNPYIMQVQVCYKGLF